MKKPRAQDVEDVLPYLSRSDNGELMVDEQSVASLLNVHGSPLIVLLPQRAGENAASVISAFSARFNRCSVHYAVKASYHRAHLSAVRASGAGIEVMSGIELQLAIAAGFTDAQIVCNGLGRDPAYLQAEAALPEALHILDSLDDVRALNSAAAAAGTRMKVAIRLAPPTPSLDNLMPRASKLGFSVSAGDADVAIEETLASGNLELVGFHAHGFTHARSPQQWGQFVHAFANAVSDAERRHNIVAEVVDIGGGFETRAVLESSGVSIDDFAAAAARALEPIQHEYHLVVEPGRYVASDAAIGVGKVVAQKPGTPQSWDIIDLATNTLIPVPGADYPVISVSRAALEPLVLTGVGDGTCAPAVLHEPVLTAQRRVGTSVAVLNCGAYTTVFAHVWGPLPPTTLVLSGSGVSVQVSPEDLEAAFRNLYGYDVDLMSGRHLE